MSKKVFLSLIAMLLVVCSLALCLASCENVTKIDFDDECDDDDLPNETVEDTSTEVIVHGIIVDPNQGYSSPQIQLDVAIPSWGELTISPNQSENIIVDFYNPEENEGKYYLTFEIYLVREDGSKDVLYKSGLVEPGKHIQKVNFDHTFEAGEYEAVIHIQTYDMDYGHVSTNNLDSIIKLIVK